MRIIVTLSEIIVLTFLFGLFVYWIGTELVNFFNHVFYKKAWAKVYNKYQDMLLDRKYRVLCKKHWWNKYALYHDPNRKSDTNYLYSEAEDIARKIESGEIKI